jgi:hypothetical protein
LKDAPAWTSGAHPVSKTVAMQRQAKTSDFTDTLSLTAASD